MRKYLIKLWDMSKNIFDVKSLIKLFEARLLKNYFLNFLQEEQCENENGIM